jgi:hypothetical protein
MVDGSKKETKDYGQIAADLMLEGDANLEKVYRRSVWCTILIGIGVVGLMLTLLFLSLGSTIGQILYYGSLFMLLGVMIAFMYYYFVYTRRASEIQRKLDEARKSLEHIQMTDEFLGKLRKRIERMRSEIAWFKQLLLPGSFEAMDKDREESRGNEEFEYFVRKFFEKMGFKLENSGMVTSSGIFMVMGKERQKYLVYPIHPPCTVGEDVIKVVKRELAETRLDSALVVTGGVYTDKARALGTRSGINLYDRPTLNEGIKSIVSVLTSRVSDEESILTADDPMLLIHKLIEAGDVEPADAKLNK